MTIVKKAGCVLVNLETKKIGLIYRQKQKDYSFPKGHLEAEETLEECAIRETEEETGRKCRIIPTKSLPILQYIDSKGDSTSSYYFLAKDMGPTKKIFDINLIHEIVWVPINKVEEKLSYPNLVTFWKKIRSIVEEELNNENT